LKRLVDGRRKIGSIQNQIMLIESETHSNQLKAALCIRKYAKKTQRASKTGVKHQKSIKHDF
jgi:hypothetical protein